MPTSKGSKIIRNKIKEFKKETDAFSFCAQTIEKRALRCSRDSAAANRAKARILAEWGFAYDEMLRGEYAEVY